MHLRPGGGGPRASCPSENFPVSYAVNGHFFIFIVFVYYLVGALLLMTKLHPTLHAGAMMECDV